MSFLIVLDPPCQQTPWYVVQSEPCKERQARLYLEADGFEVFHLRYRAHVLPSAEGQHKFQREVPLFGNYLFIHADLYDATIWHAVMDVRAIARVLGGLYPRVVPEGVMQSLLLAAPTGVVEPILNGQVRLPVYRQGQALKIKSGPFANLIGICQWSRRERVALLLRCLGGQKVVQVPSRCVTPCDAKQDQEQAALETQSLHHPGVTRRRHGWPRLKAHDHA